jgi:hypothetical protein
VNKTLSRRASQTFDKRLQRVIDLAADLSREVTRTCHSSPATVNMGNEIVRELAALRRLWLVGGDGSDCRPSETLSAVSGIGKTKERAPTAAPDALKKTAHS